jgi:hypothetical protein
LTLGSPSAGSLPAPREGLAPPAERARTGDCCLAADAAATVLTSLATLLLVLPPAADVVEGAGCHRLLSTCTTWRGSGRPCLAHSLAISCCLRSAGSRWGDIAACGSVTAGGCFLCADRGSV